MKKRIALVILGIIVIFTLLFTSCANIPEANTTETDLTSISERITALEEKAVTITDLRNLETILQQQIDALRARILTLENEQ